MNAANDCAKEPPYNFDAEQSLLGSMLINNRVYDGVSEFLRPDAFADPIHGMLYDTMARVIERGGVISPATLKGHLAKNEQLNVVGGVGYIADLAMVGLPIAEAVDMARIIRDLHQRRLMIDIGVELQAAAQRGAEPGERVEDLAATVERQLSELAVDDASQGFKPYEVFVEQMVANAEAAFIRQGGEITGISTGLRAFDKIIGGLHETDLVIIAARPGMGKTALASGIAVHAANNFRVEDVDGVQATVAGAVVGFVSIEMSGAQLAMRNEAAAAEVSTERVRRGELRSQEFDKLLTGSGLTKSLPFFIDESGDLTLSKVRARARRLKRQHGLGLLIIDYLQLIGGEPGRHGRGDNRNQEISEVSRGLKLLAKELSIPIVALAQLSRAVEQRDDKRPQLSDLRDSGSIEQDADLVIFVYREEYYLAREEPTRRSSEPDDKFNARYEAWQRQRDAAAGQAELIVAKHRHGTTGTARVKFEGYRTTFCDLDDEPAVGFEAGEII